MEFESRLPSATMRPYIKRYFWGRHAHPPQVQRYHRTVADLKRTALGSTTLTEVAWRNGYYDYAHMSADFRKICGYAPMTLLRVSENDGDEVGWRI